MYKMSKILSFKTLRFSNVEKFSFQFCVYFSGSVRFQKTGDKNGQSVGVL